MAGDPVPAAEREDDAFRRARGDESALHTVLPHLLRLLRREPALAISLGYLFVVCVGIFYNASFYRKFDIPVLTLSQIGDFLVAGIQQPIAIVLVLSTLPLCWLTDRWNTRYRRRQMIQRERLRAVPELSFWQRLRMKLMDWSLGQPHQELIAYLFIIPLYGWVFVAQYAQYKASAIKRGEAAFVRVWLADAGAEQGRRFAWLGATGSYVFVYDADAKRSLILPVENVVRIEPLPPPKRESAAKP